MMRYLENPPPSHLEGLVAATWMLDCGGTAEQELLHNATPDGCVELIWRTRGSSHWKRKQPPLFATGLSVAPVSLQISGDASFTGVRLWPWAWNSIHHTPCRNFADDWIAIPEESPLTDLLKAGSGLSDMLRSALSSVALHPIAAALLREDSVVDVVAHSGRNIRAVQRWCADQLGMPPRQYLRQLRFARTLRGIQAETATLADQAAAQGYADQSHMAREFRALAGDAARNVRTRANGPFL